jgi:hypothetical protein
LAETNDEASELLTPPPGYEKEYNTDTHTSSQPVALSMGSRQLLLADPASPQHTIPSTTRNQSSIVLLPPPMSVAGDRTDSMYTSDSALHASDHDEDVVYGETVVAERMVRGRDYGVRNG